MVCPLWGTNWRDCINCLLCISNANSCFQGALISPNSKDCIFHTKSVVNTEEHNDKHKWHLPGDNSFLALGVVFQGLFLNASLRPPPPQIHICRHFFSSRTPRLIEKIICFRFFSFVFPAKENMASAGFRKERCWALCVYILWQRLTERHFHKPWVGTLQKCWWVSSLSLFTQGTGVAVVKFHT